MKVKTLKYPRVEFVATSSRLAEAYRNAAKKNKTLAACASLCDLGNGAKSFKTKANAGETRIIILAHPDDDPHALTEKRMASVAARAFHLLFTEPATHPDQIAQWIRQSKIRSEDRLHIVRVESLNAPKVSDLLGRVCSAVRSDLGRGSIIDAYLAGDELLVRGPKHRMLHVPIGSIPALKGQRPEQLRDFQIDPDGSFLYWPRLDVHLGWNQFLQAVEPAELRKVQQRSAEFNRRYGAAIRNVREAAGISQAKIAGLTERQLRRVEQGECRATVGALNALAQAHELELNAYLDEVANAMP